ncbi:MAG TPA: FABP family protein [Acidimicrobiia bacterium]|nr:FABP family protein [Acidimicrobiia bacterium]
MQPDGLPAVLEPLAFLLGTWSGTGRGAYPTVDDFAYDERLTFVWPGKPLLRYTQQTWVGGAPSHAEVGYVRPVDGGAELVLAHPSGIAEVSDGPVHATRLELASRAVVMSPTAKEVREVRRVYERRDDTLWYRIDMAAVGQPLGFHLEATLGREPDASGADA